MKRKVLQVLMIITLLPSICYARYGDIFTAKTPEGITMKFMVTSEIPKTCCVYIENAIDKATTGHVTIPDNANGYTVTEIGMQAFARCKEITSVSIPNSVTGIYFQAFYGCRNLSYVKMPSSLTYIGKDAFYFTNLTSITIPKKVTEIVIGDKGFFGYNESLESIAVEEGNMYFDSRNNCNAIIDSKTNELLVGCKNSIIPKTVTAIGNGAFYGVGSKSIGKKTTLELPERIMRIGNHAFYAWDMLESIILPSNLSEIGAFAFERCESLKTINIPKNVSKIGIGAFGDCSNLASIFVDKENNYYDSRNNCNAIIEKNTNKLITGCYNTIIPKSVLEIGDSAFVNCRFQNITIPERVTKIGKSSFECCSNLESINLPDGLRSIGYKAFMNCIRLKSVSIPGTISLIGNYAFRYCRIEQIYSYLKIPFEIDRYVFDDEVYNTAILYVPKGTQTNYWRVAAWNRFENIKEFDPTGIINIKKDSEMNSLIYSLSGQPLSYPQKGIIIIEGKKVIIK